MTHQRRLPVPLRGSMPRFVLAPFTFAPAWVGSWYAFAGASRFDSSAFDAAKNLAAMPQWGWVALSIAVWMWVGILIHQDRHDAPLWRRMVTASGWILCAVFVVWWGCLNLFQATSDPAVPGTGFGYLTTLAFAYVLAALRVASGPDAPRAA